MNNEEQKSEDNTELVYQQIRKMINIIDVNDDQEHRNLG